MIKIGAHRGASSVCPENTMLAFREAVKLGADYIELDVHLSKDDVPIVIHNHTLNETTTGSGYVRDYMLEELKMLDAGSGERIPALEEVLQWAKKENVVLSIELKTTPISYENIEKIVAGSITNTGMCEQVQVMSFDHLSVQKIKDYEPRIKTGVTFYAKLIDPISLARRVGATIINTPWYFLSPSLIKAIHEEGMEICGSMTDKEADWEIAWQWGIDMIDSNIPGRLKEFVQQKKQESE